MRKRSISTTQRLGKEIFIAGKVCDLQVTGKDEVEASVREYLDNAIGKSRARFELCTIGNITAMFFHCGFDYNTYSADPAKDVMDANVFMIAAHEYRGFMMPVPFPTPPIPGFDYPYHIGQTDLLDAYRKSAKILGVSRIKNAWLEIKSQSVMLGV